MDVKFFNFTSNAKYRGKERIFVSKNILQNTDIYAALLIQKGSSGT